MRREIIVNRGVGETRAALLEDRKLVELYYERVSGERVVGNIYKGRVENVLPGMQAAFVNIGLERNAFLYVDDALAYRHPTPRNGHPPKRSRHKIRSIKDVLREGQEIVVQVTKEPIGTKGARVVTGLSIPGRYLVLMPTVDHIGVSRRIEDEKERNRLKKLAGELRTKPVGVIVRTVAEGRSEEELARDYRFLMQVWSQIQRKARRASPPALLYQDYDLTYRLVRDEFDTQIDKFVVDSAEDYRKTLELLDSLSPELKSRVFLYHEGPPIFDTYGVEPEIERSLRRRVWLDCGGYLVIDQTEALVSIDVNTGKFIGSTNLADTVLQTNMEAAAEIARQLRLRNMGGIIIVDFIDMNEPEHRQHVLERLEEALRFDKTRTHILGFTSLGLVEMTRKKVREDIGTQLQRPCPHCEGSGRVLSEETIAFHIQREIRKLGRGTAPEGVLVVAHPAVAALLIGPGGSQLRRLEEATGMVLYVKGRDDMGWENYDVLPGTQEELEAMAFPVRQGQVLDMQVEEAHVSNPKDGIARVEGYVVDIEGAGDRVGEQLQVEITKVFRTYAKGRVIAHSRG